MICEKKKLVKIVEELTLFFFTVGGNDISSRIHETDEKAIITISSNYFPECYSKLDSLKEFLTRERNSCIEDVYWELAGCGDTDHSSQLLLVGVMVDSAVINVTDDRVNVTLEKYKS